MRRPNAGGLELDLRGGVQEAGGAVQGGFRSVGGVRAGGAGFLELEQGTQGEPGRSRAGVTTRVESVR